MSKLFNILHHSSETHCHLVTMAKMESEVNEMSDLWRGVENRGIRKGRAEGRAEGLATGRAEGRAEEKLNAIKSLMKKLNFTMEQAMNALGVPESEQERYARLLNQGLSRKVCKFLC